MIDGEPGHLAPWLDPHAAVEDEMHAWVDVGGAAPGRVLLTTERDTATRITRALLMMGEAEPVGDEDFRDALGEVANVVGGNVKALVPDPGALTLPQVTHVRPDTSAACGSSHGAKCPGSPSIIAAKTSSATAQMGSAPAKASTSSPAIPMLMPTPRRTPARAAGACPGSRPG
jgi:hypothetical protein